MPRFRPRWPCWRSRGSDGAAGCDLRTAPVLSWEACSSSTFAGRGWPSASATRSSAIHWKEVAFRVTPKAVNQVRPLPHRVVVPYIVIVAAEAGATLLVEHPGAAIGYVYLALLAAFSYVLVIGAISRCNYEKTPSGSDVRPASGSRRAGRGPDASPELSTGGSRNAAAR